MAVLLQTTLLITKVHTVAILDTEPLIIILILVQHIIAVYFMPRSVTAFSLEYFGMLLS